jgi:tRNA A37 threonylcarbamoyladenosine dehydratase
MNEYSRTELLIGEEGLGRLKQATVMVFGVGGVGSHCIEALARSGAGRLILIDNDKVSLTNINRQSIAYHSTIGRMKTEVMRERIRDINPEIVVKTYETFVLPDNVEELFEETPDYIIDAIDSLSNKVYLIQQATKTNAVFFSSMGAALKTDPARIKVAEFWKVQGCPLAAALRSRIKKFGGLTSKFMCVYSDEVLQNRGDEILPPELSDNDNPTELKADNWSHKKARINGTTSYMPAMFGMTIASMVVRDLTRESER